MNRIAVVLVIAVAAGAQALVAQDLQLELPDRTPSNVMSYRGADWLERPERVAEEMPEEVLATLGLDDGDVIADLGSGIWLLHPPDGAAGPAVAALSMRWTSSRR